MTDLKRVFTVAVDHPWATTTSVAHASLRTPADEPALHERVPTETQELLQLSRLPAEEACTSLGSSLAGLTFEEGEARLRRYGPNVVTREQRPSIAKELWGRARNPLNALLVTLAAVSYALGT